MFGLAVCYFLIVHECTIYSKYNFCQNCLGLDVVAINLFFIYFYVVNGDLFGYAYLLF